MHEKFVARRDRRMGRLAPMARPSNPLPLVAAMLVLLAMAFLAGRWWGLQGG